MTHGDEGVVAFVLPNAWLDCFGFADGMRLCLEEEFDAIWLFNLRGKVEKLSGEAGTKGIRFLVRPVAMVISHQFTDQKSQ